MLEPLEVEGDDSSDDRLVQGETVAPDESQRRVGVMELVFLLYFLSCGGPFGTEAAVGAAGGALTIGSLFVVAFLWCVPQALVGAELSLLANSNGGSVDWVKRAFKSELLVHVNALNLLFASLTSYALLIVLVAAYLPLNNVWLVWLVKFVVVLVTAIINVSGPDTVAHFSLLLLVIVFVPFVIMAGAVLIRGQLVLAFESLAVVPSFNAIKMDTWIPTVVWSFGAFDSVGNIAGEVKGGRRTFLMGLGIAFPLVLMTYLFPTIVGLGIAPDYWSNSTLWVTGGYSLIATQEYAWLGVLMDISGALSNFGQYCASVVAVSRVVSYCGSMSVLPWVVSISYTKDNLVRPVGAIVITSTVMLLLTAISFETTVQMYLHCRLLNLICIFASFIRLRYVDKTERVFSAPGGLVMVWLYGVPTVLIGALCAYFTDLRVWLWTLVFQGFVLLLFAGKSLYYYGVRNVWAGAVRIVGRRWAEQ
jgi:amino acid transporter